MNKKNYIIEGTDASGKEQVGKTLKLLLRKEKIHLNQILEKLSINIENITIEDLKKFFKYYEENKIISDRSFFSLLNYFLMTNNLILDKKMIIRGLIKDYLKSINGSNIIFITTDYKRAKERLEFRKDNFNEKLSQNDKNIIENKEYFEEYKNNLLSLIKMSEKIISKNNLDINILKIDTSFVNILMFQIYKKIIKLIKK